jgi:hypothetical protein
MRREPNTRKGPAKPARDRSDRAFLSAEYVLYVMPRARDQCHDKNTPTFFGRDNLKSMACIPVVSVSRRIL